MLTMTVDSLDTQMLDHLGDYEMFAPPAEGWMTVEATMDDATPANFDATSHLTSVEVDMEHDIELNEDDITEYEMTDEAGGIVNRGDGDEELPDAEVLYASPMPLPAIDVVEGISTVPSVEFEHPSPLVIASQESFSDSQSQVTDLQLRSDAFSQALRQDVAPIPALDNAPTASPHDAPEGSLTPLEPTAEHHNVSAAQPVSPPHHTEVDHESPSPSVVNPELTNHELTEVAPTTIPEEDPHQGHPTHVSEASQPPVGPVAVVEPAELPHSAEGLVDPELTTQDSGVEEEETSSGDPHEISEGVYIDPPPAVLLSLSSSSARHEYSLFNQPSPSSRERSPTTGNTLDEPQALGLLLQQRPTLYYEPLTAVFEALRQEEAVYAAPELVEGELVIDAYDLQLVIPEDNAHIHEVTLHELNVIHDGSDIPGPLRLRLYAISPRFYTRYAALRDQIAGLHLAEDDDDDGFDEQPIDEYPTEEVPHVEYVPTAVPAVVAEEGDGTEVASVVEATGQPDHDDDPQHDVAKPGHDETDVPEQFPSGQTGHISDPGEAEQSVVDEGPEGEPSDEDGGKIADPPIQPNGDMLGHPDVNPSRAQEVLVVERITQAEGAVVDVTADDAPSEWPNVDENAEEQVIDLTGPDVDESYVEEATEQEDHPTSLTDPKLSTQTEEDVVGAYYPSDRPEGLEHHDDDLKPFEFYEEGADLENHRDEEVNEVLGVPSLPQDDPGTPPADKSEDHPKDTKYGLHVPEADEDGLFEYDDEDTFTQITFDAAGHVLEQKASSETLSSTKTSKRSIDQVETDDENDDTLQYSPPGSPTNTTGPKRARVG